MKLLPILALVAITALTLAPYASAKDCSRPASVKIPDGKTADEGAMKNANTQVVAYIKAANEYLKCLKDEEISTAAEAKKANEEYQAQVQAFNATPAK